MKRKLLFTFVALLCSVGSWATYTDFMTAGNGWTKITTSEQLSALTLSDYYFAFVAAEDDKDLIVTARSYGNSTNYLWYLPAKDPRFDANKLFMLASYSDGYSMQVLSLPTRYFQSASASAYDFIMQTGYTSATSYFTLQFSDGKLIIQNQYSYAGGNYFGPWNNTVTEGDRIAGNKGEGSKGTFYLYAISRSYQETIVNSATIGSGKDVSFLLPDAKVELTQGFSPWTSINPMGGSDEQGFCPEYYNAAGFTMDTYQTINVPNGKYEVKVNGFYRYGDDYAATTQDPKLYANSAEGYIPSISEEANNRPNNHLTAAVALNGNRYLSDAVQTIVTNGTLKIGVKKTGTTAKEWMAFDNFTLTYYGNRVEALATSFTSGNSATAGSWYAFSVPSTGWYKITPNSAGTFSYTQTSTDDADGDFSRFYAPTSGKLQYLTSGTLYFKTNTTATVTIAAASISANDDVTGYINDPSFEHVALSSSGTTTSTDMLDWSVNSNAAEAFISHKDASSRTMSNTDGNNLFNTWQSSGTPDGDFYLKQTLHNLPIGKYELKCYVASDGNATVNVAFGASNVDVACGTDKAVGHLATVVLVNNSVSDVLIAVTSKDWFKADNFTLKYLGHALVNDASAFTSGSTVVADAWNSYTVASNGLYSITSSTAATISYSQDGDELISADFSTSAIAAGGTTYLNLNDGTFYFNSNAGSTITITKLADDADITSDIITNPSFETGDKIGWSFNYGGAGSYESVDIISGELADGGGNYYYKSWRSTSTGGYAYQTISLPAGHYSLSALLNGNLGTNSVLYVKAGDTENMETITERWSTSRITVYFDMAEAGDVIISGGCRNSDEYHLDDFKLTYNPTLPSSLTAISGDMNATVASTQSTAITTYAGSKTFANLLAAQTAMNNALASKLIYEEISAIQTSYATLASALDAAGQAAYSTAINKTTDGAAWKYTNGVYETAAEAETAYNRDYITAVKAQMTDDTDMTEVIKNPSFETGDFTGWTNGGMQTQNNTDFTSKEGTYYVEKWHDSGAKSIKQAITGLHQGKYRLTAAAFAENTTSPKVYVKVGDVESATAVSTSQDYTVDFDYDGSSTLEIGCSGTLASDGWLCVDNFRLTYLETYYALEADYTNLNSAITTAEGRTLGFEDGEYAPYNLAAPLAVARAIDQEANNVATVVRAATSSLNSVSANDGEVNAIAGGYNLDSYTNNGTYDIPNGWSTGGEPYGYNTRILNISESLIGSNPGLGGAVNERAILVKYSTTYGESAGYTMPLKANTVYALSFKYGIWNEEIEITKSLSVTDPNGATITVYPGSVSKNEGDKAKCANVLSTAWYDKTVWFETGETAGDYVLNITGDGNQRQMVFSGLMLKKAVPTTLADNQAVAPTAGLDYIAMSRTYSSSKWNTLCLPFALNSTETSSMFSEVKVLDDISVNGDVITMSFDDATEIAAGQPYLVKAVSDDSSLPTALRTIVSGTTNTVIEEGDYSVTYQGTLVQIGLTEANSDAWVVSNNNLYNVDSNVSVKANRAYFTVGSTSGVKSLLLDFDGETTDIKSIEGGQLTIDDAAIYNLAGQRMSKPVKGINIVNGKKVIIK